jgi:leader peptidase (prepilin peptidase) / N-methyltransferase
VGAAARHRLALACPYPPGLGWGEVRPSGRGAGHVPGWPGARAFATGLVFPFVLAAASSAAMIAAGAATRKSRIPSGPYMTGAAAAVILASP